MKRYSQHHIKALLDKFMDGQTTVEEEALLADYFRSHDDVPAEWEDYRDMFAYFDRGMEGDLVPTEQTTLLTRHQWWGIAAAACITAAIVAPAVLHNPTTTTLPDTPPAIAQRQDTTVTPAVVETEPQQLASATPASPVSQGNATTTRQASRNRRLQAENAKLARENERLQRELADLKRRAFIIDLEANGFRAVQDEDGSIVLIDLEQELENELNNHLNNQPTTNIPAL